MPRKYHLDISKIQHHQKTDISAMYLRYDADKLLNSEGDPIGPDPRQPGSIDVNSYAASLWYVSDFKLLGGNYGFMLFPVFTDNALEAPIFGLDQSTNTGFTDFYFQPLNLGWHTQRADFTAGFGMVAPTGKYEPGASDNLGLGMWSFEPFAGATVYFDEARTWHLATTAFYEMHTKKRNTDIRVGDILTLEGGLGKSFLGGTLILGVSYYAQFEVTHDDVGPDIEKLAFRLELKESKGQKKILWYGLVDGQPATLTDEPHAGPWLKFKVDLLGILSIESQL